MTLMRRSPPLPSLRPRPSRTRRLAMRPMPIRMKIASAESWHALRFWWPVPLPATTREVLLGAMQPVPCPDTYNRCCGTVVAPGMLRGALAAFVRVCRTA